MSAPVVCPYQRNITKTNVLKPITYFNFKTNF